MCSVQWKVEQRKDLPTLFFTYLWNNYKVGNISYILKSSFAGQEYRIGVMKLDRSSGSNRVALMRLSERNFLDLSRLSPDSGGRARRWTSSIYLLWLFIGLESGWGGYYFLIAPSLFGKVFQAAGTSVPLSVGITHLSSTGWFQLSAGYFTGYRHQRSFPGEMVIKDPSWALEHNLWRMTATMWLGFLLLLWLSPSALNQEPGEEPG